MQKRSVALQRFTTPQQSHTVDQVGAMSQTSKPHPKVLAMDGNDLLTVVWVCGSLEIANVGRVANYRATTKCPNLEMRQKIISWQVSVTAELYLNFYIIDESSRRLEIINTLREQNSLAQIAC